MPSQPNTRAANGGATAPFTLIENARRKLNSLPSTDDWAVVVTDLILECAASLGATDLHIACLRDYVLVRARMDGLLMEIAQLPVARRELLVARLKILSKVPSFVRHEPQDGRIEWPTPAGIQLLRTSFLPTMHGESVVIRFPEVQAARQLSLGELGMPPAIMGAVEKLVSRREGAMILTGPSSSGKTTTLYALLERLYFEHGNRLNIVTIEDPIERDLGFASQVQINTPQGLTFDSALRAALRHDPNVIMLGEIRDAETARVVVQAGMSGHLVLSTLHAGRANRVFARLLSMGIDPYLIASSVCGALSQRLARRLCSGCKGVGCANCFETGMIGRVGIFEVAPMTEELRALMLARASPAEISQQAMRWQVGDLVMEGNRLVEDGVISREELVFQLAEEA